MRIRKYIGENNQEAIQKVKNDLGSDALIISTKKVRQKGIWGVFKKKLTEVTAAIDDVEVKRKKAIATKKQTSNLTAASQNVIFQQFQNQLQNRSQVDTPQLNTLHQGISTSFPTVGEPFAPAASLNSGVVSNTDPGMNTLPNTVMSPGVHSGAGPDMQSGIARNIDPSVNPGLRVGMNSGARDSMSVAVGADTGAEGYAAWGDASADIVNIQNTLAAGNAYARSNAVKQQQQYQQQYQQQQQPQAGSGGEEIGIESIRLTELEEKIDHLEKIINKVYGAVASSNRMVYESENVQEKEPLTKVLKLFYNNLVKNEVEPEYSMDIVEKVSLLLCEDECANDATAVFYNAVFSLLGKPETINLRNDKKPTVAILVGPTGVGKTTTLAKIAANHSLEKNLKVGLITADTYRIAAVEQLKTYAEILGLPISVIYAPNELKKAIEAYNDKDLVLIDTAGRNYRGKTQFDELKDIIAESCADEVFLVLSSTSGIRNNKEVLNQYGFLKEFKLIFTKTDETPTLGMLLNTRLMTGKSLSYVTIGQSVPDDIEIASIDKITRNLIGS
ncbi:MAG: hypothetical protein FWH55_07875 [Oscillospiraceae bacterium]|nr:hypothetical protein [Oscillospiraceae bacterium]